MKASEMSSSASSSKKPTDFTMRGETVEESESKRLAGPLTKQQFLAYLIKIGKLSPDTKLKQAS